MLKRHLAAPHLQAASSSPNKATRYSTPPLSLTALLHIHDIAMEERTEEGKEEEERRVEGREKDTVWEWYRLKWRREKEGRSEVWKERGSRKVRVEWERQRGNEKGE